ncbi:Ubiquitin-like superfamily protein [Abeliophyllum distichum]|uniref:Ubiquitin-like superfamily protein n=1 Tax=Abeliophyllum distichum TaxID=126358 RepID=A0ABD1RYF9_9LAMI
MVKLIPSLQNKNRFSRLIASFSQYNNNGFTLGSQSYKKLPRQLLKISILKLDGSSFSVEVSRNATVASLEFAVEEVYGILPQDDGNILWSLVWSHFCLCYEGQQLINEKACLQSYGIKDGDELHFSRHMRIDHKPARQQSEIHFVVSKQQSLSNACDARANGYVSIEDQESDRNYFNCEAALAFPQEKFNLTHFWKEWLSCSKLHGLRRGRGTHLHR